MLTLLLSACGKKDEPTLEAPINIKESFIPAGIVFSKSDYKFLNKCLDWTNKTVIVNSVDELPNDPGGFSATYYKIDFDHSTLLLTYKLHQLPIDKAEYSFIRNYYDNTYDWYINITSSSDIDEIPDNVIFSRMGIVVPKLPESAKVRTIGTVYDSGWEFQVGF